MRLLNLHMFKTDSKCEHNWVIEEIFTNFRGDTVSVLYRCTKCGATKRETT